MSSSTVPSWADFFRDLGAVWHFSPGGPHAVYTLSGKHSDSYFNTNTVVAWPPALARLVREFFQPEVDRRGLRPDWILTYPPFGIPIAFALAQELDCRFGYIQGSSESSTEFPLCYGDRVIVVSDDIYSGGSVKRTIQTAQDCGCEVLDAVLTLGNFSGASTILGLEIVSAMESPVTLWDPSECPLCRSGSPPVPARTTWDVLTSSQDPQC